MELFADFATNRYESCGLHVWSQDLTVAFFLPFFPLNGKECLSGDPLNFLILIPGGFPQQCQRLLTAD